MTAAHLVLADGTSIDPTTSERSPINIAIEDGRIAAVSSTPLDRPGATVVDCTDRLVLPGLVDIHSHVHDGVFDVAVPADEGHLHRGVVFVNDAGSVGVSGLRGFRTHTYERADVGVSCYLNVSSVGLVNIHVSEFAEPSAVLIEEAAKAIVENPDMVRGVKVRLSESETGDQPLERLAQAIDLAERGGVRLMAHVGATTCSYGDILEVLRPGDMVTHCFHGKAKGIVEDGRVIPAAWEARERGVLFDVGHGTTQSRRNWYGPAYDLASVLSKVIALGMPMGHALHAATARPAELLGIADQGYGTITVGGIAAITVVEERAQTDVMPDARDDRLEVHRLEPTLVVHGHQVVEPIAWRGTPA
jgi:dihydroorotase